MSKAKGYWRVYFTGDGRRKRRSLTFTCKLDMDSVLQPYFFAHYRATCYVRYEPRMQVRQPDDKGGTRDFRVVGKTYVPTNLADQAGAG